MRTKHILTALAATSLIVGGQALAQGRGGGHGHGAGHAGAGAGTHGGPGHGVDRRTDARTNSQGPAHANDRARVRANDNSVLATGRTSTDLSLLRRGLVVRNSTGTTLGTISRINRASDGRIVNVLVRDPDGRSRTIPVAPNSLTINGDIVTTTLLGLR